MVERDSSSFLEPDVYLVGQFVIERGKMTAFVLQLEVDEDDVWYPIIRYDTSSTTSTLGEGSTIKSGWA